MLARFRLPSRQSKTAATAAFIRAFSRTVSAFSGLPRPLGPGCSSESLSRAASRATTSATFLTIAVALGGAATTASSASGFSPLIMASCMDTCFRKACAHSMKSSASSTPLLKRKQLAEMSSRSAAKASTVA